MRPAGLLLLLLITALTGLGLVWMRGEPPGATGVMPRDEPAVDVVEEELHGGVPTGGSLDSPGSASGSGGLSRGTASRLAGRCVLLLVDERVAGVRLEFCREERRLAAATSDTEGEFELEVGRGSFDRVEITPPEGLWVVDHGLKGERYEVCLAPLEVGPLRARLLDEVTGEPVPHYAVEVRDEEGSSETVTTDAEGVLLTESLFSRGRISLRMTLQETTPEFAGSRIARHEHRPSGARPPLLNISTMVGPTYFLLLEKPDSLPLSGLQAYVVPVEDSGGKYGYTPDVVSVRPGELPWVRLVGNYPFLEQGRLVVTDANGRWKGTARVGGAPGVHHDPVPLRLERQGRLAGRFLNAGGEGVSRVKIQLTAPDPEDESEPFVTESGALGNFIFEGVAPGTYSLSAIHSKEGSFLGLTEVVRGDEEHHEFRLSPHAIAGDIAGAVRSNTGTFHGPVSLELKPRRRWEGRYVPGLAMDIAWAKEGGVYVGRFRFVGVPVGEYSLYVKLLDASHGVRPKSMKKLEPPVADLEFVIQDDR